MKTKNIHYDDKEIIKTFIFDSNKQTFVQLVNKCLLTCILQCCLFDKNFQPQSFLVFQVEGHIVW